MTSDDQDAIIVVGLGLLVLYLYLSLDTSAPAAPAPGFLPPSDVSIQPIGPVVLSPDAAPVPVAAVLAPRAGCGPAGDHSDVVAAALDAEVAAGNGLGDECAIFAVTQRVVAALQAQGEPCGLLIKSGDNVCNGRSISRVMYPDGSVWKILTDAGPGGTNGAEWSLDDTLTLDRYDGPGC